MRDLRQADVEAAGPVRTIPRLLRLPGVQEHQETGARRRVNSSVREGEAPAEPQRGTARPEARPPKHAPLVGECLSYLRAERDASTLTIRNYGADLAAFRAWYEEKSKRPCDWTQLDQFQVRGYLVHLTERRLERTTIHLKMSALR